MSEFARPFVLQRNVDETGISGTGVVAWGVVFPDGVCVLRWSSEHRSTAVYVSVRDLIAIHGHGGNTEIVWQPGAEPLVLATVPGLRDAVSSVDYRPDC